MKSDIAKLFQNNDYEKVTQMIVVSGISDDLDVSELSAVTHSFFEIGNYVSAIAWGNRAIKKIHNSPDFKKYRTDMELILLDLIVCHERLNQTFNEYKCLIEYFDCNFENVRVKAKLDIIERKILKRILWVISVMGFTFIGLTYILEPGYKHSLVYTFFLIAFVVHLCFSSYKQIWHLPPFSDIQLNNL